MSDGGVAAIVCEGHTDFPVLQGLIRAVWPEMDDIRCIQPELDAMERAKSPSGWTAVRTWCQTYAGRLDEVIDPDIGDPIDLLLIAIDLDIAIEAGIVDPPTEVGVYETPRLRKTMKGWLLAKPQTGLQSAIVLSTPTMAIETWIIASLFRNEPNPESIRDPAAWLVKKAKLRRSPDNGKPWKELHLYRDFAKTVQQRIKQVRKTCYEAEWTCKSIEQRRRAVDKNR